MLKRRAAATIPRMGVEGIKDLARMSSDKLKTLWTKTYKWIDAVLQQPISISASMHRCKEPQDLRNLFAVWIAGLGMQRCLGPTDELFL